MNKNCLNCNSTIDNNFCPNCGQKTTTHRFTYHHFTHDFVHGVFHLDKGFSYTIKELLIRPGHSIREFIQGKRVQHFNYFTLLLLVIALEHFIRSYSSVSREDILGKELLGYAKVAQNYNKIIRLIGIPFFALVTWLMFRKSKQNFLENVVLNIYMMCGSLLLYIPFTILIVFYNNIEVLRIINNILTVFLSIYMFCFIIQYFSTCGYKKYSLILRSFFATFFIVRIYSMITGIASLIGKTYFH
ncbi:DUF3667 domain-containing protein [Flavobacterium sp. CHNK8]|uniref:DUF3667 domain-containing protein n=1 Tax=Flavobacterium sp. CHNK8 TaxID=2871165 RepID=UPI001C8E1E60|nr:DUF3667 domain-containing protein [Flavobacterium sp. CHNK8]QZK91024.1 DUF3667 domain-containing protein [Flavobacterium sp. CHNK8]